MEFDFEGVFNQDYLYFYGAMLTPERNEQEVERIVRLSGATPAAHILDAPCGHGRITNLLARQFSHITGLDQSSAFIERARRDAANLGVRAEYVQGDMRELPWDPRSFDLVLNWFTSFGYFEDDENRKVLSEFFRVLTAGGLLMLDLMNFGRLLAEQRPCSLWEVGEDLLIDETTYDIANCRTRTERTVVRDGIKRKTVFTVRQFTAVEISDWLRSIGFQHVMITDQEGEPFTLASRRMLVRATK